MASSFVAAAMLLIIAGSAAVAVGSASIEQSLLQGARSDMQIASVRLHDLENAQKAFIAFTITNTGTSELVSANVSFLDDGGSVVNMSLAGHIGPGESWKERHFIDAQIHDDGRYVLYVRADSSEGSEIAVQKAVEAV